MQDGLNIPTFEPLSSSSPQHTIIDTVLRENNLYSILGVPLYTANTSSLRRAYLSRSRACHPECVSSHSLHWLLSENDMYSKFPNFPPATLAFQKVSVAYELLSSPASKRTYDTKLRTRSTTRTSDEEDFFFTARPTQHAYDTFYGVLGAVFADFMEGDFEMIRTFISACVPWL
jgi:curved DNA-binding protein CbpA